jgi:hypothetical protein
MRGPRATLLSLLLLQWPATAGEGGRMGRTLDGVVVTTAGVELKLSSLWGKPTVLFYENRDSIQLNQGFKDLLFKKGRTVNLLDRASVVAVACLTVYDFFPARQIALAAVRDSEKKAGVPVYVDFKGTLAAAPNALPTDTSSVVVLDREGKVKVEFHGRLDATQQQQALATLEAEIASGAAGAP